MHMLKSFVGLVQCPSKLASIHRTQNICYHIFLCGNTNYFLCLLNVYATKCNSMRAIFVLYIIISLS